MIEIAISPAFAPSVEVEKMRSTIDPSTVVYESGGIKRAASPLSPCLSSSVEHQHEFPDKRQRTTDLIRSLEAQHTHATSARAPPSISPFTSMQHSKPGIKPRGPGEWFKPHDSLYNFYTKATIKTRTGVVDLERVLVDEGSPFNLVPWSIATNLNLMLYSGKTLTITTPHHLIQTNHYSQFTIQIAGHKTTINTGVVSGLQTILLGREWIRSVHLLSDIGKLKYYISIPLAVEVAEEGFPDIFDTEAEAKNVKPVAMATSDKIAEGNDDDELPKADCGDSHLKDHSSREDGLFSESETSFDGQNLLDSDTPSDEPLSSDDTLSDGGTSSEGPTSDEHEDMPTNKDDEDSEGEDNEDGEDDENTDGEDTDVEGEDNEDGEDDDGEDECGGCELCDEYNECDGCEECEGYEEIGEGEEDPDDNLQDFMEQAIHLERSADSEQTDRRQSDSDEETALTSAYQGFSHEHSAMPDPTKSQVNEAQARITKRQSKEIANLLNHISRTHAGQSFKAPVEQLWPECAGAYAAKVPNPIDLGTIQMKVKNNRYSSVNNFRADIVLLYQNSVDFNGIDHIITSTALEVRDTILNALNDMEEGKGSTMFKVSTRAAGV